MSWTTLEDVRDRLIRRWRSGAHLGNAGRRAADQNPAGGPEEPTSVDLFPLRVGVRGPSAAEMVQRFSDVRDWAARYVEAESDARFTVEWKTQRHRRLGENRIPTGLVFGNVDVLAAFLGPTYRRQLSQFRACIDVLATDLPELIPWGRERPFDLLEIRSELPRLIAVSRWVRDNPRPGIYLRQLPVAGVDTKFLERNRSVLGAWLDVLLPDEEVRRELTGVRNFELRFGFRTRPELVRFRVLDPSLSHEGFSDLTVRAEEFARWGPRSVGRVFVLENDVTGLAFPAVAASIVVFGRGYCFSGLQSADWLRAVDLVYWGDLDTHGFAILDQFRSVFPHARSMLMDTETLLAHEPQWGVESKQTRAELHHLTEEERRLYESLRDNTIREGLRLEQELIAYPRVKRAVREL